MSTPEEVGWHWVGKHSIRFEPPDIVFTRPSGDMSKDEFRQIAQYVNLLPQPEKVFSQSSTVASLVVQTLLR
jgi:hypothetical protein